MAKILNTDNVKENMEQQELFYVAGRSAKCYSCFGKEFHSFLKNYTHSHYMIY